MQKETGIFQSWSLNSEIKYIIDEQLVVSKSGKYTSGIGGTDIVNDSVYYSTKLSRVELESFKNGKILKFAGRVGSQGWTTKELQLNGFSKAYDLMCS